MGCQAVFTHLYQKMRDQLGMKDGDDDDPDIRCTFCTRKEKVNYLEYLRPGDHICMGGQNYMQNIGGRQMSFYTHHAIVKHIDKMDSTKYAVTMIHFYSTSFDDDIKIIETTEMISLGYYEIYKICYSHKTHSPEKIIERAMSLTTSETTYKLFSCNCEHFCHWCCIGNGDSYQVTDMFSILRQIATGVLNIGGKALKAVTRVLMVSLDDVAKAGFRGRALIGVPWGVLSVMALAYLIYCIIRHRSLNKDLAMGQICSRCCKREKLDLWMKFFIYCGTQIGGIGLISLVIAAGFCNGVVFGCVGLVSVLTILLMWGIPKLKNVLSSPFKGKLIRIRTANNIWIGDVISFKYMGKMHDGIVSRTKYISDMKAEITVIHYSLPRLFGRRIIEEEDLTIDLTEHVIKGHDYSSFDVHSPEVVVQRARQRLGETKYGVMSNRSCHFCHWAKVKDGQEETLLDCPSPITTFDRELRQGEDISGLKQININHKRGRKYSTKKPDCMWARIPEDVEEGEVIQFKYSKLQRWHYAITTAVHHSEEKSPILCVTVVHYGQNKKPCEETFEFDLRYKDVWIYKYHPIHRFSRQDVVRRARARLEDDTSKVIYQRSWKLVQDIVPKNEDQHITNFDEVDPGDVIIFYYWTLKHAAVVTMIGTSDAKANNRAFVTIIHYALDNLFATRTVKQERVLMDLKRDTVYKRSYDGYVTYPAKIVVKRARSRLNEKRFSPNGNTSWDLVHWAKVIQNPSMVTRSSTDLDFKTLEADGKSAEAGEKMVLLPKTGKQYGRFQRVRIHAWRDLQPGIIVDYLYYWIWHQGILTDVDYKAKKITVIHYGTNTIFSTRTIMEDTFRINLKGDELWMYKCDPNASNSPELTVALARERLGEQKWSQENKSWHFCKSCVLKKRPASAEDRS